QDLLVPDRRDAVEVAVDDADGLWTRLDAPEHVALGHRRQADEVAERGDFRPRQCRTGEQMHGHDGRARAARARAPGSLSESCAASRPGMTARTTGTPMSGLVKSTTRTCGHPTAASRACSQRHSSPNVSKRWLGIARKSRRGPDDAVSRRM